MSEIHPDTINLDMTLAPVSLGAADDDGASAPSMGRASGALLWAVAISVALASAALVILYFSGANGSGAMQPNASGQGQSASGQFTAE